MTTCSTCGCPTGTAALAFLHERVHQMYPEFPGAAWFAGLLEAYAAKAVAKERERVAEVLKTEIRALLAQEKRAFGEEAKAHFASIRDCVESIAFTLGVDL